MKIIEESEFKRKLEKDKKLQGQKVIECRGLKKDKHSTIIITLRVSNEGVYSIREVKRISNDYSEERYEQCEKAEYSKDIKDETAARDEFKKLISMKKLDNYEIRKGRPPLTDEKLVNGQEDNEIARAPYIVTLGYAGDKGKIPLIILRREDDKIIKEVYEQYTEKTIRGGDMRERIIQEIEKYEKEGYVRVTKKHEKRG